MPVYEYRCTGCETRFEVSRPMSSKGQECCPSCGNPAKRIFTPVGVAFKGSGFHNTDYRPKAKNDTPSTTDACPVSNNGGSACASCPAAE
jgi:putative FmdB family regulatory protein